MICFPLVLVICFHHIDTDLSYRVIKSASQLGIQLVKSKASQQESQTGEEAGAHSLIATVHDVPVIDKVHDGQKAVASLGKHPNTNGVSANGLVDQFVEGIRHRTIMPVVFGFGMLSVFFCAIVDCRVRSRADPEKDLRAHGDSGTDITEEEAPAPADFVVWPEPPKRSLTVVVLLTSYRFYTGFLGATWVPFLIAKEGTSLFVGDSTMLTTASFMGICKMIYGFSIFLNPFFGLLSDKLAATARWGGRSAFLLVGIGVAGIGIYAAKIASESRDFVLYLGSSCLWMLGEAMADITTETVAPEMLPRSQYDLASAIRSMHHLLGALVGYLALILAAVGGFGWRWLYVSYLGMMLLFALPTVACVRQLQSSMQTPRAVSTQTTPAFASLYEAYIGPMRYSGGFPRACLGMCVFSLGTGPLFFTLLMLHDLVGLDSPKEQQLHFSCISITFLVGAVITAACSGVSEDPNPGQNGGPRVRSSRSREAITSSDDSSRENKSGDVGAGPANAATSPPSGLRWTLMFGSIITFGLVVVLMPTVGLPNSARRRLWCFYIVSFCLGIAFGSVYSRFQACTWSLLPPRVQFANAMGFAAVAKLVGTGFGNFVAGVMLDSFRNGSDENGHNYHTVGYFVMCWCSATCVFISAALVWTIYKKKALHPTWSCCFG